MLKFQNERECMVESVFHCFHCGLALFESVQCKVGIVYSNCVQGALCRVNSNSYIDMDCFLIFLMKPVNKVLCHMLIWGSGEWGGTCLKENNLDTFERK